MSIMCSTTNKIAWNHKNESKIHLFLTKIKFFYSKNPSYRMECNRENYIHKIWKQAWLTATPRQPQKTNKETTFFGLWGDVELRLIKRGPLQHAGPALQRTKPSSSRHDQALLLPLTRSVQGNSHSTSSCACHGRHRKGHCFAAKAQLHGIGQWNQAESVVPSAGINQKNPVNTGYKQRRSNSLIYL